MKTHAWILLSSLAPLAVSGQDFDTADPGRSAPYTITASDTYANAFARQDHTLEMSGGFVTGSLKAHDVSIVEFTGGTVQSATEAFGISRVNILGGATSHACGFHSSELHYAGGEVGVFVLEQGSQLDVYGTEFDMALGSYLYEDVQMPVVDGFKSLTLTVTGVDSLERTVMIKMKAESAPGAYDSWAGTLSLIHVDDPGSFSFEGGTVSVPEPAHAALLALLAALAVAVVRRRRS